MTRIIPILILFISLNIFSQVDSKKYFEDSKKLMDSKEYEKALTSINYALKKDSLNRNYIIQKVKILFFKSDCNNSFLELNKLISYENNLDDETIAILCEVSDCMDYKDIATEGLITYIENKKYQNNEMIIYLAIRLCNNKKYDEGIKYYRQYIKLKPDDIDSVIDFSRIIYSYEGSENGINEIKNNLQNNPNNLELLKCLASFYNFNKDYINAIEVQNQIIKSYYTVENINVRAILYSQLGKPDKVYEDLNRIIEIENCNAEYYSKILQYEYENKMYEKVIENSYKVIECNASYENSILDGLYTSLFFCGDFLKGNLYLDKKLASNPNNINPYYIKSLILLKNKQYDDVLKCLDLALKSKDIEKNDIVNINTVKFGFYLLKEDYQGFVNYFNSGDVKTLDNNLNFTFIEDSKSKVTEIKTDFNKTTGAVNSSIIIPTKVFKLLEHKYGLKIELEK